MPMPQVFAINVLTFLLENGVPNTIIDKLMMHSSYLVPEVFVKINWEYT